MEPQPFIDARSIRILLSLIGMIVAPFIVLRVYIAIADRMHVFLDLPTDTPVHLLAMTVGIVFIVIMPISIRARVITTIVYLPIVFVMTSIFIIGLVCDLGVGRCL